MANIVKYTTPQKLNNVFPIDVYNRPNLKALIDASTTVGKVIGKGDIVVYESTVYPGVTEEECLPVVKQVSGMKAQH